MKLRLLNGVKWMGPVVLTPLGVFGIVDLTSQGLVVPLGGPSPGWQPDLPGLEGQERIDAN